MIEKKLLCPERRRKISGSFAFIEHRFLRDGFFASLSHHELLLYLFLVLVADREGLSYYSFDKICTLLTVSTDQYLVARNSLIQKDLIAFDGHLFQVLSLPEKPVIQSREPLKTRQQMEEADPATIHQIIKGALGGDHG
jgi:Helix-turn-helix domain